ncbi:MAG: hypothetical protein NTZ59_09295, partial [Bacteroidetes bacterium]|nr:hypothetical protein [Bacteroidota bacterium]
MMRFAIFLFAICYLHICANAQIKNSISLNIDATYKANKLQFDSINYLLPNSNDSIVFTNLKFYITNIKLLNNAKIVYSEKGSYHLIDIKKNIGFQMKLAVPPKVKFNTLE